MYLLMLAELSIEHLPSLSPNIIRRIRGCGIDTIGELLTEWSERRFLIECYQIGKGSIERINSSLAELGLAALGKENPRDWLELAN